MLQPLVGPSTAENSATVLWRVGNSGKWGKQPGCPFPPLSSKAWWQKFLCTGVGCRQGLLAQDLVHGSAFSSSCSYFLEKTKTNMEVTSKWPRAAGHGGPYTGNQYSDGECETV